MKYKNILFLIICFSFNIEVNSQDDASNTLKYWKYRQRLRTIFLKPGEASTCGNTDPLKALNVDKTLEEPSGFSIPAQYLIYSDDFVSGKALHWGDAPLHLGWYMGVLATEYKLLKNAGLSTDSVKQELYYAMKAYERLDSKAERFFYPSNKNYQYPCVMNGFFVRDDVNKSFFDKYINYDNSFKTFTYQEPGQNPMEWNKFSSDWGANYTNESANECGHDNSGSIDHIGHLFMAFALIKECLESDANYNGFKFREKAMYYADLIASRQKSTGYKLIIPNTNDQCQAGSTSSPIEAQGAAFFIAKAADWITNKGGSYDNLETQLGKLAANKIAQPYNANNWIDYLKEKNLNFELSYTSIFAAIGKPWVTGITGRSYLDKICVPYPEISTSVSVRWVEHCAWIACVYLPEVEWHTTIEMKCAYVEYYKYCIEVENTMFTVYALLESLNISSGVSDTILSAIDALMTIINTLSQMVSILTNPASIQQQALDASPINNCIPTLFVNIPNFELGLNMTSYVLSDIYAKKVPDYHIYHLLYKFLHRNEFVPEFPSSEFSQDYIRNELNLAACRGIYQRDASPWYSRQRYEGHRLNKPQDINARNDLYNGLDYMLLHNLYRLNYAGGIFPAGNQMNNSVTASVVTPNSLQVGYNQVQTSGAVNVTGNNSAFVSQNQVVLNPGFSTSGTAKFVAKVDPDLGCSTSSNSTTARVAKVDSEPIDTLIKPKKIARALAMADSLMKVIESKKYKPLNQYLAQRKQEVESQNLDVNQPKVSIVPNPASKNAQLIIELKESSTIQFEIINALGAKVDLALIVEQINLGSIYDAGIISFKMDVSSLPNGIYFIKLFTSNSEKTTKLIIQ